jgi:hypothetical protein
MHNRYFFKIKKTNFHKREPIGNFCTNIINFHNVQERLYKSLGVSQKRKKKSAPAYKLEAEAETEIIISRKCPL